MRLVVYLENWSQWEDFETPSKFCVGGLHFDKSLNALDFDSTKGKVVSISQLLKFEVLLNLPNSFFSYMKFLEESFHFQWTGEEPKMNKVDRRLFNLSFFLLKDSFPVFEAIQFWYTLH